MGNQDLVNHLLHVWSPLTAPLPELCPPTQRCRGGRPSVLPPGDLDTAWTYLHFKQITKTPIGYGLFMNKHPTFISTYRVYTPVLHNSVLIDS